MHSMIFNLSSTLLMKNFSFICHRYEGALDPWMSSLWSSLYQINPELFPKGLDFIVSDTELMGQPKVIITYHATNQAHLLLSDTSGDLFSLLNFVYEKSFFGLHTFLVLHFAPFLFWPTWRGCDASFYLCMGCFQDSSSLFPLINIYRSHLIHLLLIRIETVYAYDSVVLFSPQT